MPLAPSRKERTWVYGGITDDDVGTASAQNAIQKFLLFIAVSCIPVMLFAKPYVKYKAQKEKRNRGTTNFGGVRVEVDGNDDTANILEGDELANEHDLASVDVPTPAAAVPEEEFDLANAMIIQARVGNSLPWENLIFLAF